MYLLDLSEFLYLTDRQRKFLSYYQPYLGWLALDLLCSFVVASIVLILPLCVGYITDTILTQNSAEIPQQIFAVGMVMLALMTIHTACNYFVDYRGHVMGAVMESDMRRELFAHYQNLSFGFYDEQKVGQLMTRLTNDLFNVSELYHHGPEDLAILCVKFFGTFIILFAINVPLTLIIMLLLPFMAVYTYYFNGRMRVALRRSHDRIGDINAQVEDSLAGIRVVQSFTNEHLEQQKFDRENQRFVESRGDGYRSEAYLYSGLGMFTQTLTIVVIVFGGLALSQQTLELPSLLTYLLCVGILIEPFSRMINFTRLYQEGITGFNRFMDMLEIQPEISDAPHATTLSHVKGHVRFENVSFRYKAEHSDVLNRVSLDIRAGEYVALVGASGVGKTTLCSLIPRFYDVTDGAIYVDGHDIRTVTLRSLRQHIGMVQQDVYLFAGTVLDNIRYGKLDATQEEVILAAKKANAHDFIMGLPNGYNTDIGQRGVKLSGGQKQRLSIARVFLKNPSVIILDEATSALDNESEKAIKASLEALAHNRTTLVIAHRLSTIRNAQRILVLTDDGISEQGTHAELLQRNGAYAHLYHAQSDLLPEGV